MDNLEIPVTSDGSLKLMDDQMLENMSNLSSGASRDNFMKIALVLVAIFVIWWLYNKYFNSLTEEVVEVEDEEKVKVVEAYNN